MTELYKIRTQNNDLFLRVAKGHFATSHSHTNYFIDVTTQKTRISEAKAVAKALVEKYRMNTIVDTVLCVDGTEVIGACVADELTREDFVNMNAHQTVYVVAPEYTANGQIMFRDNVIPMIHGKHVLIVAASVTTGKTAQEVIDAVTYYGGNVVGVSAIFATVEDCQGYPVNCVYDPNDLEDYESYNSHNCPMCKNGMKLEALVNSFGYSKL